ncbi:MAG: DNA polymerase I [Hydrogenibacillus sp.]|nr:DNA polymerase I [Hydrogenibacillus sp.]
MYLIDGSSVAHRAFYALPPLSDPGGRPTNAVYGFALMLLKLIEEAKPTHIAVVFDAGKTVFRHELYAAYKGTRQKSPPELVEQFPLVRELVAAFNIALVEQEGYEADDVIGTLAVQAEAAGFDVRIISSDRDLLQLIDERIAVGLTRKGMTDIEWMTEASFREAYGIAPGQYVDVKALMGDASDNIPGVPGVGEKTALRLIAEHGSLDAVYDRLESLKGKLRERLAEHRDSAYLSRRLATIERNVSLPTTPDALAYGGYDASRLVPLFRALGFRSLLGRLTGTGGDAPQAAKAAVTVKADDLRRIRSAEEADAAARALPAHAALIIELDGDNPHRARLVGGAIAAEDGTWAFLPEALESDALRAWLADPNTQKVAYDVKKTYVALSRVGVRFAGAADDLLLMQYLLDATRGTYTLSDLARTYGLDLPDDALVYGKGAKFRVPEPDALLRHLSAKARAVWALRPRVTEDIERWEMQDLYRTVELSLAGVLAEMELYGVKVDREALEAYGKELEARIRELEAAVYREVGFSFNLNSTKQLGEVLYDKLGIPPIKKTKTGYSTDAETLEKLAPLNPVVLRILDYRLLTKLRSTYIEGLIKEIHEDGKIHTTFHQALTATGRLSSSDPNLQNIPIRLEEGRKIRRAFVPSEPGWRILSADYSQIELRVLAHMAADPKLIEAFQNDADIHTQTAMDVFGLAKEDVTPLHRRQAKAVNFGIIYGISDYGLSQNLGISRKEAADFIERYFAAYPDVKRYLDEAVQKAREFGYVETLFGRRRTLPDITAKNFARRSFAERTAMNTPIQGTAADIIKKAMIDVDAALRESGLRARMLLQVHDELVFEVAQADAPALSDIVREKMEGAAELRVPLKVDVAVGDTWYDAK